MTALEQTQCGAVSGGIAPLFLRVPPVYRLPVEPPTWTAPGPEASPES